MMYVQTYHDPACEAHRQTTTVVFCFVFPVPNPNILLLPTIIQSATICV